MIDQLDAHEFVLLRLRLQAARRSGRKIHVPAPSQPAAARLDYFRELLVFVGQWNAIVRTHVLERLGEFFEPDDEPGQRTDAKRKKTPDEVDAWLDDVDVRLTQVVPAARSRKAAKVVAKRVDKHNRTQRDRQWKQALGIDLRGRDVDTSKKLTGFVRENVGLISTIPKRLHRDVRALVDQASTTGMRVGTLAKQIEARFDVSKSRAQLIARDQTNKLNGELTQIRQEAVGITTYDWATSEDERVRPDHAALDGTTQKWSKPPVVDKRTRRRAHPGGDYQCRCNAIPNVGELLDRMEGFAPGMSRGVRGFRIPGLRVSGS